MPTPTCRRSAGAALALILLPAVALAQAPSSTAPLTLGDAARIAAERAPSVIGARARAVQGAARTVQARAELLPQLSSEASMDGGSEASGVPTGTYLGGAPRPVSDRTVDLRLQATQKILDLGAIRRVRASSTEADALSYSAVAASESAASRGALAFLDVQRADARLAARVADSALAAELLDIARQQLQAGTAIALDVTRAESQLASIVSQLISARSARSRAQLELVHALALPVSTRVTLGDSLQAPTGEEEEVNEAKAVETAMTRRGELLAAGSYAEAARRQISAVRAERLPTVSLFSSAASTSDGMLDNRTYGVSVSFSLFDGLRRESRIAEHRAREQEADAEMQDLKHRIEVDVRSAMLDLAAAKEQVAAADVRLHLAEQEVDQARERFSAGVAGNSDVIQASLSLNQARDVVVDARTTYHQARVNLAVAQGTVTELR
jgi:outer membrane protein